MNLKELTLTDLAYEYEDYFRDLMACEPSESEDSQARFFMIQSWGESLERKAKRHGFTWEQVEEAADI